MHGSITADSAAHHDGQVAWPTGIAALAGGCLLAVFYLAHAARVLGLVDGRPGPIWLALFLAEAAGLLLLLLSMPGWCSPLASASPYALLGALLLAGGLVIWALAAASNFAPDGAVQILLPTWLYSVLVAVGSPIVAATWLRTARAPHGAVLLIGLCAPVGMVLLATPEWVYALTGLDLDWPVSPLPGQVALAAYALGWSWAGLAHRQASRRAI